MLKIQREKLRMAAKLTHKMYGRRSRAAAFEIPKKLLIVKRMAIQRRTMSMSPKRGDLSPKKAIDQKALRINWIKKKNRALLACG
jgi:hypothetical protein